MSGAYQLVPHPLFFNNLFMNKTIKSTVAVITAALTASIQAEAVTVTLAPDNETHIYGNMSYSEDWVRNGVNRFGIYELPLTGTPSYFDNVVMTNELRPDGGSVYFNGKYFNAVSFISPAGDEVEWTDYLIFDTKTWTVVEQYRLYNEFSSTDMAYDPTTDKVYGCFFDFETSHYYFGTVDLHTAQITKIKRVESRPMLFKAIDFDATGQCYAITAGGYFVKIDKVTGDTEIIEETGILASEYILSGAIDPKEEIFYYTFSNDTEDSLYAISLATGKATKVYNMPDKQNWDGVFVLGPQAKPSTPGTVTDLRCALSGNSHSGEVTFKLPATLYDGNAATGTVTYDLLLNGVKVASGSGECGSEQKHTITVDKDDKYVVAVVPYNEAGRGGVATANVWVGDDVPAPVTNISLSYTDGAFNISWDAATGLNGGYVDPSKVTYNLLRFPDLAKLDGVTATSATISMPEPESIISYYYEIVAVYEGHESEPATSPLCTLGAYMPPYSQDFTDEASLNRYTIIDGNNDNETWRYYGNCAVIWVAEKLDHDDWLILPAVKLEGGTTYKLSFDASVLYGSTETYEVKLGTSPKADAMLTDLIDVTEINNTAYTPQTVDITVPETGVYYIGIHALSDKARATAMFIDNIEVSTSAGMVNNVFAGNQTTVNAVAGGIEVGSTTGKNLGKVNVYAVDGRCVAAVSTTSTSVKIPLETGFYVVTVEGAGSFKVNVR